MLINSLNLGHMAETKIEWKTLEKDCPEQVVEILEKIRLSKAASKAEKPEDLSWSIVTYYDLNNTLAFQLMVRGAGKPVVVDLPALPKSILAMAKKEPSEELLKFSTIEDVRVGRGLPMGSLTSLRFDGRHNAETLPWFVTQPADRSATEPRIVASFSPINPVREVVIAPITGTTVAASTAASTITAGAGIGVPRPMHFPGSRVAIPSMLELREFMERPAPQIHPMNGWSRVDVQEVLVELNRLTELRQAIGIVLRQSLEPVDLRAGGRLGIISLNLTPSSHAPDTEATLTMVHKWGDETTPYYVHYHVNPSDSNAENAMYVRIHADILQSVYSLYMRGVFWPNETL